MDVSAGDADRKGRDSPQPKPEVARDRSAPERPEKNRQLVEHLYKRFLPQVDFAPDAIKLLVRMDKQVRECFEKRFAFMNIGQVTAKDQVTGIHPPVYEADAGDDRRIYYRQNGGYHYLVVLVGFKHTQDRDCEWLREQSR